MPHAHNTGPIWRAAATITLCIACALNAYATELNHASEADLDSVRGIGPAMTARLLAERERQPFADWADLQRRVKGIGTATATRWSASGVTVNGQVYPASATASVSTTTSGATPPSRQPPAALPEAGHPPQPAPSVAP